MTCRIICRAAIKNDSSAILRSGKRFAMLPADAGLPEESGYTPTLSCLAYKQKWPPKRTTTLGAVKLFEAALLLFFALLKP